KPVGDHAGGDDHRVEAPQRLVVHPLEALVDLERALPLVAGERQPLLPPEPGEEVDLRALLGEAPRVVPDLRLVEVGLHQHRDLLALEALRHCACAPVPVATAARWRPWVVLTKSAQRSAIITIPAWQFPDCTAGITLASAIRSASTPWTRSSGST